jgi:hypothetical protein
MGLKMGSPLCFEGTCLRHSRSRLSYLEMRTAPDHDSAEEITS